MDNNKPSDKPLVINHYHYNKNDNRNKLNAIVSFPSPDILRKSKNFSLTSNFIKHSLITSFPYKFSEILQ